MTNKQLRQALRDMQTHLTGDGESLSFRSAALSSEISRLLELMRDEGIHLSIHDKIIAVLALNELLLLDMQFQNNTKKVDKVLAFVWSHFKNLIGKRHLCRFLRIRESRLKRIIKLGEQSLQTMPA